MDCLHCPFRRRALISGNISVFAVRNAGPPESRKFVRTCFFGGIDLLWTELVDFVRHPQNAVEATCQSRYCRNTGHRRFGFHVLRSHDDEQSCMLSFAHHFPWVILGAWTAGHFALSCSCYRKLASFFEKRPLFPDSSAPILFARRQNCADSAQLLSLTVVKQC